MHGGTGDGLVVVAHALFRPVLAGPALIGALGAEDNAVHGLHRGHRVVADRGFRRQHHRVGAVEHRVGHVGHFRAGRLGAVDHGLHHLRGGDHEPVQGAGATDDVLLYAHQLGVADFHRQVAARHHHAVGGDNDVVQHRRVGDRFGPFDLGDHVAVTAGFAIQGAGLMDVVGVAGERQRQEIHFQGGRQLDVLAVLVGEGLGVESAALAIDAFIVGQLATHQHPALDAAAGDVLDAQGEQAVVQQQGVAGPAVFGEPGVVGAHLAAVAGVLVQGGVDGEGLAGFQHHRTVAETGDANLGALQIGEDRHVAGLRVGLFTDAGGDGAMIVGAAVGEIKAEDVDAGVDQPGKEIGVGGGRAEGGDDFGASEHGAAFCWDRVRWVSLLQILRIR